MIDKVQVSKFSERFSIRILTEEDVPGVYDLCIHNRQYYDYCKKQPSIELIKSDLIITPPGKDISDKYYIGFFDKKEMVAVMDLIDGYPEKDMVFIGFFMMNIRYQGKGVGSQIITDLCNYLKNENYRAVRLGIDKGNPQSTHFWKKNGFQVIKEVDREDGVILLAEQILQREPSVFQ